MTLFTVLEPPDANPDKVIVLPEGFSWGALVFTFFWALFHRLWMVAALVFAGFTLLSMAVQLDLLDPVIASLLQLGVAVILGFEGRHLQVMALERAGFRRAGLIQATAREAAELAYFAGRAPAPARYRGAPPDTLGIFGNV
jgi:hypothetical protein